MLGLREGFVAEMLAPQLFLTWALLALGVLALAGVTLQVLRNILRLRAVLDAAYTVRSHGRIRILSSDGIAVPFTARGWRRFFIVVPAQMLADPAEAKIAVGHELQHIRQGDAEWEIALELLRPLFFWNRAFGSIHSQLRSLREFACDQEFLKRLGLDRRSYGNCLIDVAQRAKAQHSAAPALGFSVPPIETDRVLRSATRSSNLGRRILALTHSEAHRPSRQLVNALMLPLSVTLVFASQSTQQPRGWSHDRIMLSTVINLERLHSRNATQIGFASPIPTGN